MRVDDGPGRRSGGFVLSRQTQGRSSLKPSAVRRRGAHGFTLIEILVTILLLVFGLLGMIGLQARGANIEFESYQRGQALSLAREMASRMANSRSIVAGVLDAAVSSTDGSIYWGNGTGTQNAPAPAACPALPAPPSDLDLAKNEACEWAQALLGVAAKDGASNVGAMIGARGCVIRVEPPNNNALADLYVVVVWQALRPGTEPPAGTPASDCSSAEPFGAGLRRGVSVRVMVPDLSKAT
jgi:type IV pilus assembly protein PilV